MFDNYNWNGERVLNFDKLDRSSIQDPAVFLGFGTPTLRHGNFTVYLIIDVSESLFKKPFVRFFHSKQLLKKF